MASAQTTNKNRDPAGIIGREVAGRYLIEKCIGVGGMGVVYLAKQNVLDRKVVLKVIKREYQDEEAGDPDVEERFIREARSLSKLDHPNVVSIFEYGSDPELGITYIVMEYVHGVTLRRFLRKVKIIPLKSFVPLAREILKAVAAAHAMGLIHRDLKPSNIMVVKRQGESGHRVKVLDFGLSKLATGGQNLTRPDQVLGSALYMAPEAIKGRKVDARADVYALGALFFRMLSGKAHVEGDDSMSLMYQQVHGDVLKLADHLAEGQEVPEGLTELVDECLSKDPDDRPQNAQRLLRLLEISVGGNLDATAPLSLPDIGTSSGQRPMVPTGTGAPTREVLDSAASSMLEPPSRITDTSTVTVTQSNAGIYFGFAATIGIVCLIVGLGLLGVVFMLQGNSDTVANTPVVVAPMPVAPAVDEGQAMLMRARQVAAIKSMERGDYPEALGLVDEALRDAAPGSDTKSLSELRKVIKTMMAAMAPAPVAEPEPEPEPVASPSPSRSRTTRPRPRATPRPRPVAKPAPPPGPKLVAVAMTSNPPGLTYAIAGRSGTTPAVEQLEAGTYPVILRTQDGKQVYSDLYEVEEGEGSIFSTDVTAALAPEPAPVAEPVVVPASVPEPVVVEPEPEPEPEPVEAVVAGATGTLVIHSDNVFGEIFVNGTNHGYPPITVRDVPVGTAKVEVRVKGRVRKSKNTTVNEGRSSEVRL